MRIRLLGHFLHLPLLGLALAEFVSFCAAMFGAVLVRMGLDLPAFELQYGPLLPRVLVFGAVSSLTFLALGLYTTRQRAGFFGVGLRIVIALLVAIAVVATVFFVFPSVDTGRGIVAIAAAVAGIAAFFIRMLVSPLLDVEGIKKRVLVYGVGSRTSTFSRLRRRGDRAGFNLVGVVCHPGDAGEPPSGETIYKAPDGLKALCLELGIDELVVALQDRRRALPIKELLQCRLAGISVVEIITFLERETGRIELDLLNPSWIIFGEGFRRDGVRMFTARVMDILATIVLLVFAAPIMLLTMLAIWLEDGRRGGGIFYRQNRVGFEGRVFPLTKFRSMQVNAESGGAQWAQKNDPRVTRVGAFIRKTRIDELPQLLNVLLGHMGFVGPRPERPEFVADLEEKIPYYAYRHSVKPGITGWAQLCYPYGSSIEDARQKLQYDLYYVKHHNLLFDLTILLQTVEVVLMGKGAR